VTKKKSLLTLLFVVYVIRFFLPTLWANIQSRVFASAKPEQPTQVEHLKGILAYSNREGLPKAVFLESVAKNKSPERLARDKRSFF
jgi:hypothetical protein